MLGAWFFWDALLAGLGSLIALGHPLTILVSAAGAPFTSLCPFIGVGMVAGLVQAVVCKPKVSDLENLQDSISIKGFYKNRLLRVLLVFVLSSLGSSIGTFAAGTNLLVSIAQLVSKIFGN